MIILETQHLILRDLEEADIQSRIIWDTEETEWQQWDAPWEYEGLSEDEKANDLLAYVERLKKTVEILGQKKDTDIRFQFQLVEKATNKYIGWVNSYYIDDDYCYSDEDGHLTIGIDIPDLSVRGKGYAKEALTAVIDYFAAHGYKEIYTQTWSGNARMIHIAEALGFKEIRRKKDIRLVRGAKYDGLTFLRLSGGRVH